VQGLSGGVTISEYGEAMDQTINSPDGQYRIIEKEYHYGSMLECYERNRLLWAFKPERGPQADWCAIRSFEFDESGTGLRVTLNSGHFPPEPENERDVDVEVDLATGSTTFPHERHQALIDLLIESYTVRLAVFTQAVYTWLLEDPDRLRTLTAENFELLIADRLKAMGLGVQLVGGARRKDGGVDLIAWPDRGCQFPFLLAGQVKHHHADRKTGAPAIRDFLGAITSEGSNFHLGLVVTNTSFSADAKWFAKNNGNLIRLRDLNDLCRWMQNDFQNEHEWREIPNQIELAPGITIPIPKKRIWFPER
jgi:hypothetical protein